MERMHPEEKWPQPKEHLIAKRKNLDYTKDTGPYPSWILLP